MDLDGMLLRYGSQCVRLEASSPSVSNLGRARAWKSRCLTPGVPSTAWHRKSSDRHSDDVSSAMAFAPVGETGRLSGINFC
jgi:hypothetical protein